MTRSIIPRGGWVAAAATALFALLAAAVLLVAAGYLLALLDGSGQSGAGQVQRRRISA